MEQTEMIEINGSMGGHFSAFINNTKNELPGQFGFESARSALFSLIKVKNPERVYLPAFVCQAVPDAVAKAGASVVKYSINSQFRMAADIDVKSNDLVVLINFFGINELSVVADLAKLPKNSVIVDCSQAFFSNHFDCLASFYSPRKFIPVADGGYIKTNINLLTDSSDEQASIRRYKYLLQRSIGEPESSRHLYLDSEASLSEISSRRISSFTQQIIATCDLGFIRKKRVENFQALAELDLINKIKITLGEQIPLCYPLMLDNGHKLRGYLQKKRIFTPIFWPTVLPTNDFERFLLSNTIYLPIDHRYGSDEMSYLKNIVLSFCRGD